MQVHMRDRKTSESPAPRPNFPANTRLQMIGVLYVGDDQSSVTLLEKRKSGFYVQSVLNPTDEEMRIMANLTSSRQAGYIEICDVCNRICDGAHAKYSHMAKMHKMRRKHSRL